MSSHFKPLNCFVTVDNNLGSVRLRWSYQGKRYNLNVGLPYDSDNLSRAISIAYQIDFDLKNNTFVSKDDYKIKKKSSSSSLNKPPDEPLIVPSVITERQWDLRDIFNFYCNHYHNPDSEVLRIRRNIQSWFDRSPEELLTLGNADLWLTYLRSEIPHKKSDKKGFADKTIATGLRILKAGVNFAIELGKIEQNPFVPLYKGLDTRTQKEVRGYTSDEIMEIIRAFREDKYCSDFSSYKHSFYADFIEFRFLTGCRPSEAIALTGGDLVVKNYKTFVRFNKRYVKGELKGGLKNKKSCRFFPCNYSLMSLIESLPSRGENELLFKAVRGGYIKSDVISQRYWKPIIEGLVNDGLLPFAIPFYDQRHTFGSLICRKTPDIKTVSSIMGNSPSTLYRYYLADDLDFDVPEF